MTDKEILQRAVADEQKLREALWIVDDCISSADSGEGEEWEALNKTVYRALEVRQSLIDFLQSMKEANEVVFGKEEIEKERL